LWVSLALGLSAVFYIFVLVFVYYGYKTVDLCNGPAPSTMRNYLIAPYTESSLKNYVAKKCIEALESNGDAMASKAHGLNWSLVMLVGQVSCTVAASVIALGF
jgi:hypothetical protein